MNICSVIPIANWNEKREALGILFTEDDVVILKDNYLKIGIDIWNNSPNPGFIAYIGTTKIGKWHWSQLGLNKNTAFSCHGATGPCRGRRSVSGALQSHSRQKSSLWRRGISHSRGR